MAAPTIDLDALRATYEPWSFTTGGRRYVARPVSIEQVIAHEAACVGESSVRILEERRKLLRLAFPWRLSYRWRGDPVALICGAEPAVYREIWESFSASLHALSPKRATPGTTPSTDS